MPGKFEVKKTGSKFRYVLLSQNGKELIKSQTYATRSACKQAIVSLQKAATKAKVDDLTTSTSTRKSTKSRSTSKTKPATKAKRATTKTKTRATAKKRVTPKKRAVAKKATKSTRATAVKRTKAKSAKSGPVRKQQRTGSTSARRSARRRTTA